MKSFDVVFYKLTRFLELLLTIIFLLLLLDVLLQVFSRHILNISFSFTEELARFLLIWLTILGSSYLNAKKEHLSMDYFYTKFSKNIKPVICHGNPEKYDCAPLLNDIFG